MQRIAVQHYPMPRLVCLCKHEPAWQTKCPFLLVACTSHRARRRVLARTSLQQQLCKAWASRQHSCAGILEKPRVAPPSSQHRWLRSLRRLLDQSTSASRLTRPSSPPRLLLTVPTMRICRCVCWHSELTKARGKCNSSLTFETYSKMRQADRQMPRVWHRSFWR